VRPHETALALKVVVGDDGRGEGRRQDRVFVLPVVAVPDSVVVGVRALGRAEERRRRRALVVALDDARDLARDAERAQPRRRARRPRP
jgi:hypothetical protein